MKKKIKDLTLEEVANICKRCDSIYGCPFYNVLVVDCQYQITDKDRRTRFESEIEVEDE